MLYRCTIKEWPFKRVYTFGFTLYIHKKKGIERLLGLCSISILPNTAVVFSIPNNIDRQSINTKIPADVILNFTLLTCDIQVNLFRMLPQR